MVPDPVREMVVAVYHLMTPGNILLGVAFLVGVGLIPMLIFFRLLPGAAKRIVARIMWTVGALSLGGYGYAVDMREDGRYETNPVIEEDGEYYVLRGGEKCLLEGDEDAWSRLGWRRFCITYEKDDGVFESLQPQGLPEEAAADGGMILTGVERGGYPEVVVPPEDGYAVSMSRVDTQMEGAGGPEPAFVAGEQALKNHGGDNAGMGNVALVVSTLFATIMGAAMAYVMVGL